MVYFGTKKMGWCKKCTHRKWNRLQYQHFVFNYNLYSPYNATGTNSYNYHFGFQGSYGTRNAKYYGKQYVPYKKRYEKSYKKQYGKKVDIYKWK